MQYFVTPCKYFYKNEIPSTNKKNYEFFFDTYQKSTTSITKPSKNTTFSAGKAGLNKKTRAAKRKTVLGVFNHGLS